MNNFLLLIALSEKEKRVLIFLIVIIALIVVLVGLLYNGLIKLSKKWGKGIDPYIAELCKNKVLTSPKELIECVNYRERKRLYLANRWIIRFTILSTVLTIVLFNRFLNNDYKLMAEALDNLWFKFYWERGNFFGFKNCIVGWPNKITYPHPIFDLAGTLTYVNLIIYIILIVFIIRSMINYYGRINRAKDVAAKVFNQDLDTATFVID